MKESDKIAEAIHKIEFSAELVKEAKLTCENNTDDFIQDYYENLLFRYQENLEFEKQELRLAVDEFLKKY